MLVWGIALVGPAAQAQVWTCEGHETMGILFGSGGSFTDWSGLLTCPTDSWPFNEGVSGATAIGSIAHQSDGDSTEFTIDFEVTAPGGSAFGNLFALGYFLLDFDEATIASFDYDVQDLQGSGGSVSIVRSCADPNGTAVGRAGGVDFYFGPGGGSCHALVEPRLSFSGAGSYESVLSVTGTSSPLPITPSLASEILDEYGNGDQSFYQPWDVGVDSGNNVFSTSDGPIAVYQVAPDGTITHALDEFLGLVIAIAVGPSGDVYVADAFGNAARRFTPGGSSTLILDSSGDGAGSFFSYPTDIAVDTAGNAYVTGRFSQNAFKITPGGSITEIIDASGDGVNAMDSPQGVDVDAAGNVYVAADPGDVFKITPGGAKTRIIDATGDGAGNPLIDAFGIAVSPAGDVYVSGRMSDNVFHIDPTGTITQRLDATGNGSAHLCDQPMRLALDPQQNVYVTCFLSDNVLQVAPDGSVTELMDGSGDGAGNPLRAPHGIAYRNGRLYVVGNATANVFRLDLAPQIPLPWGAGLAVAGLLLLSAVAFLRRPARRC